MKKKNYFKQSGEKESNKNEHKGTKSKLKTVVKKFVPNINRGKLLLPKVIRQFLADRIFPFSVFNLREKVWQDQKKAWLSLGIQSEKGREHVKSTNVGKNPPEYMANRGNNAGGSIFCPALTEIICTYYGRPGGIIIDPFAGGSVRGIVASCMGFQYYGCDLSQKQIIANQKQAEMMCSDVPYSPVWIHGDAAEKYKWLPMADLIMSCPPYGNLEVYSNDPRDLSNMKHDDFLANYKDIIVKACSRLKDNSFACFVVGDYRKDGFFTGFPEYTTECFIEAGLRKYNEHILLTPVGSVPIRASRPFKTSRKAGTTHQVLLVFFKGDDPKDATQKMVA